MIKTYFILLLLCHILGDYYFQSEKIAANKNKSIGFLFIHSFIYFATVMIIMYIATGHINGAAFIAAASHFVIDLIKFLIFNYYNNKSNNFDRNIYITDQLFHILILCLCSYFMRDTAAEGVIIDIINSIETDKLKLVKNCLIILLLHKPANITIKVIIGGYKPIKDNLENKKTGAIIGTLERYLIFILLYLNQYSAIGLVLTAKSIARYKELENKSFAEYYLIGTLLSTLIVIVIYMIIYT